MLCRRCGLDSSTTDVCEWCKRPILPPGAAIAGKKALGGKGQPQAAPQGGQPAPQAPPAAQAPPVMPPSDGLKELKAAAAPDQAATAQAPAAAEDALRPLGDSGAKPAASRPGAPSHGLSDDATRTSVEIANYLGPDQSLFKPVQHAEFTTQAAAGMDPLARRRRKSEERKSLSDIPDNIRLIRALMSGIAISLPLAIVQFVVTKSVPGNLYFLKLGPDDSLTTALLFGLSSGVLLGFGLGALLVQFKKGPFLGVVVGLVLGAFGLQNGPWGIAAAAITGIVVGRIATVGYRRALQI